MNRFHQKFISVILLDTYILHYQVLFYVKVYKAIENDNCHLKMSGIIFLFVVISNLQHVVHSQTKPLYPKP